MKTTDTTPHIGANKLQPGDFGYEFDFSISDCAFRMNYNDKGGLLIVPPDGKTVGLSILWQIQGAPDLLDALKDVLAEADFGDEKLSKKCQHAILKAERRE